MQRRAFLQTLRALTLTAIAGPTTLLRALAPAAKVRLTCNWQMRKRGKYLCDLSTTNKGPFDFNRLYVNGELQTLARFPDVDKATHATQYTTAARILPRNTIHPDLDGAGPEARNVTGLEFDPATFTQKRWGNPDQGILHVEGAAADIPVRVRGIDYDRNILWCDADDAARAFTPGTPPRFYVEGLYEECNAIHEWYLYRDTGVLYYLPSATVDLSTAVIEMSR